MPTQDDAYEPAWDAALRDSGRGTVIYNLINTLEAAKDTAIANDLLHDDQGVAASATLEMTNQPTTTDTIGIGADTYEFLDAPAAITDDSYIGVAIGATAALTRTALVAAINATYSPDEHPSITNIATTGPALANGTESLVADVVGATVRIRTADAPGGTVTAASPSIVLAESITNAASIWDVGDVNLNTLAGRATSTGQQTVAEVTITAAMITNGLRVDVGYTPVRFVAQVRTSAGVVRAPAADAYAIANDGIAVTFGGGVAPDMQATDVLTLLIVG